MIDTAQNMTGTPTTEAVMHMRVVEASLTGQAYFLLSSMKDLLPL